MILSDIFSAIRSLIIGLLALNSNNEENHNNQKHGVNNNRQEFVNKMKEERESMGNLRRYEENQMRDQEGKWFNNDDDSYMKASIYITTCDADTSQTNSLLSEKAKEYKKFKEFEEYKQNQRHLRTEEESKFSFAYFKRYRGSFKENNEFPVSITTDYYIKIPQGNQEISNKNEYKSYQFEMTPTDIDNKYKVVNDILIPNNIKYFIIESNSISDDTICLNSIDITTDKNNNDNNNNNNKVSLQSNTPLLLSNNCNYIEQSMHYPCHQQVPILLQYS